MYRLKLIFKDGHHRFVENDRRQRGLGKIVEVMSAILRAESDRLKQIDVYQDTKLIVSIYG